MPRRVFHSFHYKPDSVRAARVRNIGAIEGNAPAASNDWEAVTRGGEPAIKRWIDSQMSGRSCVVVLVGAETAGRKWIDYEIIKGWNDGKGVVGVHIHRLVDFSGLQAPQGANPFDHLTFNDSGRSLSTAVKCYNPPYFSSADCYNYIAANMEAWIEEAITIRGRY